MIKEARPLATAALVGTPLVRLTRQALLLFIFLLPLMQPSLLLFGFDAVAADAGYLLLTPLWTLAVLTGAIKLRWHHAYWLLGFYLAALILSATTSEQPLRSAIKLVTQLYLLSLPVIVFSLVTQIQHLHSVVRCWLAATTVVVLIGLVSVALFAIDPDNSLLTFTLNHFGTLPPGNYPRLRLTMLSAAMLCNYLTVSLVILLIARQLGWVERTPFVLLLVGILFAAAFSLTPGLGGIFLTGGVWIWLLLHERRRILARLSLAAGVAAALLFVAAMVVTPILHPTAPFLITVPGTDFTLAPAGRLLTWIDALKNFTANPLAGRGIGVDAVDVHYLDPSGNAQVLTDAHNTYLNIAAQCGLIGLLALLALLFWVLRNILPFRLGQDGDRDILRVGLGFAFLNAFAYQGLGGSFEDSRHLWVLFGLILASDQIRSTVRPCGHSPRARAQGPLDELPGVF
jgi:O-antigen ligase